MTDEVRTTRNGRKENLAGAGKKYKILVVEDNEMLREGLAKYLSKRNYDVLTAYDGKMALELMEQNIPNALITDYSMPRMGGKQLIIECASRGYDFPIILHTEVSKGHAEDNLEGYSNWEYLSKNTALTDLKNKLEEMLTSN